MTALAPPQHALIAIDLETTRTEDNRVRIIEVAAVRLNERLEPSAAFNSLANPGCAIRPIDARVTGLSDDAVRSAPPFQEVLISFLNYVRDATLISHNAHVDRSTLVTLAAEFGLAIDVAAFADTLKLARRFLVSADYRLGTLSAQCGDRTTLHRALPDAKATALVFRTIVQSLRQSEGKRALDRALSCAVVAESLQQSLF